MGDINQDRKHVTEESTRQSLWHSIRYKRTSLVLGKKSRKACEARALSILSMLHLSYNPGSDLDFLMIYYVYSRILIK